MKAELPWHPKLGDGRYDLSQGLSGHNQPHLCVPRAVDVGLAHSRRVPDLYRLRGTRYRRHSTRHCLFPGAEG
jgi:hypothetical protein